MQENSEKIVIFTRGNAEVLLRARLLWTVTPAGIVVIICGYIPLRSAAGTLIAAQIVAIVVNYISRVSVSVFVLVRVPYISLDCLDLVSAASRSLYSF